MYPLSSQRRFWTFNSEIELNDLRTKHNELYIAKHADGKNEQECQEYFLSTLEEKQLLLNYEIRLEEFCKKFEPPMPKSVIGTAFHYFKRFYIHNSPMDYHPKEILVTCVYLACKVDEFNVSIGQFVGNVKGDRLKAINIILSNELLLMQHLNYYLTIHNPYRPIEGFLIDIKTRCSLPNPERLRPRIDEFIEKTFLTDACLLYAPSQIALAAVLHATSKEQENLDSYVTECLFHSAKDKLPVFIDVVRKIRSMVRTLELPNTTAIKYLEKKLDKCRNQENNPDSEVYKQKMKRLLDEEDEEDGLRVESEFNLDLNDPNLFPNE